MSPKACEYSACHVHVPDIKGDTDANGITHTFNWQMDWYIKLEEPGLPCGSATGRCLDVVLESVQVLKYKGPEMLVERRECCFKCFLLQMKPFHLSIMSSQPC